MSSRLDESPSSPLSWNPSIISKLVNKTRNYLVSVEDFEFELNAYTQFEQGGQCVLVSGLRLFYLLRNKERETVAATTPASADRQRIRKKSCRNVCFQGTFKCKSHVTKLINDTLRLPPCMRSLLTALSARARGNRFKKRFIFNCYILNLITCTKCDRNCLMQALSVLYDGDEKCAKELESLCGKETLYKPPNCANMKDLCLKSHECKGSNPLCNK
ncbi:lef2 protein [Gynaephora ruoergensis nucleopolyhedrovirus]|nr:lef2 protein [Gynaephora ruoergensis nucleopolyhedrovirus]